MGSLSAAAYHDYFTFLLSGDIAGGSAASAAVTAHTTSSTPPWTSVSLHPALGSAPKRRDLALQFHILACCHEVADQFVAA